MSVKGKNKCLCIAKLPEAHAAVTGIYPRDEENDALGDLGKYTPLLVGAAVVGLIISLIKR